MTIGRKLKELRISKNYTQQEAADAYGCSRQYLNGVENGKITLGIHAIRKFALLYKVDVEVLAECLLKGEQ